MRTAAAIAALAAAAALAWVGVARARPERKGRVVRVERPRFSAPTPLRVCIVRSLEDGLAACFGSRPSRGETGAVLSEAGMLGRVEVVEVGDHPDDRCAGGSAAQVEFRWDGRPPTQTTVVTWNLLVLGLDSDPRKARAVSQPTTIAPPSGRTGEQVWTGLDRESDGEPDLLVTWHMCTDTAPPNPRPGAQPHGVVYCLDLWGRDGGAWQQLRGEHYYACH